MFIKIYDSQGKEVETPFKTVQIKHLLSLKEVITFVGTSGKALGLFLNS